MKLPAVLIAFDIPNVDRVKGLSPRVLQSKREWMEQQNTGVSGVSGTIKDRMQPWITNVDRLESFGIGLPTRLKRNDVLHVSTETGEDADLVVNYVSQRKGTQVECELPSAHSD